MRTEGVWVNEVSYQKIKQGETRQAAYPKAKGVRGKQNG